jgi:hypothetical protein
MTTPAADPVRSEDVEVELHELLDWGHEYEAFVDLLRDKLNLDGSAVGVSDDTEYERCMVQEYAITGVPRPNVVTFTVRYVIEPTQADAEDDLYESGWADAHGEHLDLPRFTTRREYRNGWICGAVQVLADDADATEVRRFLAADAQADRSNRTAWRVTAADLDALAGRELTDDELERAATCIDNSTANEAIAAAVDQVVGYSER